MDAVQWTGRLLRREVIVDRRAVAAVGVGATVLCLTLAAYARVYLPFSPVPVTLQTFFVLVAGAALGPSLATVALSSYLVLGTIGLPLFAGGWLGATTGYLVGFVPAGWVIARIVRAAGRASTVRLAAAMVLGTAIIYACGGGWLLVLGVPPRHALLQGVVVFLPGDLLKLAAAAALCRGFQCRFRQLFP